MANPNCEYIVDRLDKGNMEISVSRERFKDSPALEPLGYRAEIIDLDRVDGYGDPITSLVLLEADAPQAVKISREPRGKAQRDLLAHLRSNRNVGPCIWTIAEMREMCPQPGARQGHRSKRGRMADHFRVPDPGNRRISDFRRRGLKGLKRVEFDFSTRPVGVEKVESPLGLNLSTLSPTLGASDGFQPLHRRTDS
jgi:hypothetical protein